MRNSALAVVLVMTLPGCGPSTTGAASSPGGERYHGGDAPLSLAADHVMIDIQAGQYIAGSTLEEREQAYSDHLATAKSDIAREQRWFDIEQERHVATLPSFKLDQQPVTNAAYAEFVRDTGEPPPSIDEAAWNRQGLKRDFTDVVRRFNWSGDRPPPGREEHPAVLVSWQQAERYCEWRGALVAQTRRLPSDAEYEKAARGPAGRTYPWGASFDADKLNSRVRGPLDTVAVGSFPAGASEYGVLDTAGNVHNWTSTAWPHQRGLMTLKGSTWTDFGGMGRGASRSGQDPDVRDILVGFRCAANR